MKKIIITIIIILIIIPHSVKASTQTASSYVLIDYETGRILSSKNENKQSLVASISKIMTALIAIESGKLDKEVTVDETILKAYGSCIYIEVGEKLTLRDLVYGLMLRSGNDAALMISKFVSGSEEKFVKEMNQKALKIGMKNSLFNNPSGLDEEDGNYSSAYDMALLMREALKYKDFRIITSTKKYKLQTNYKTYIWTNKNKLLSNDFIIGGKTGYTKKAGRTLVSAGNIDENTFIVVTIKDSDDWNTHLSLYDNIKGKYKKHVVLEKNNFNVDTPFYKNKVYIKKNVTIPLTDEESKNIKLNINLKEIKNPYNNDTIGSANIILNNKTIHTEPIYFQKTTPQKNTKTNFFKKIWRKLND